MDQRVHYTNCPVCNSYSINPLLTVKDFTVSGEEFVIWHCNQCTLRFTQDVPDAQSIGKYYKAEDYISITEWKTKADAENYESSGTYRKLVDKVRHLLTKEPVLKTYQVEVVGEMAAAAK